MSLTATIELKFGCSFISSQAIAQTYIYPNISSCFLISEVLNYVNKPLKKLIFVKSADNYISIPYKECITYMICWTKQSDYIFLFAHSAQLGLAATIGMHLYKSTPLMPCNANATDFNCINTCIIQGYKQLKGKLNPLTS